jgi:DNA-directed RNA polymerase subunit H (RpoH/RPB5)/superfamily II DNA or RNA helicase
MFKNIVIMMEARGYLGYKREELIYIFEKKNSPPVIVFKQIIKYSSGLNFSKTFYNFFSKNLDTSKNLDNTNYIILCGRKDNKKIKTHKLLEDSIYLNKKLFANKNIQLELFNPNYFNYNILNHKFVPIFTKVENTSSIKKQLALHKQLPKLYMSDPISRYYNYKEGDIIKIQRKNNGIPIETIIYRIVEMDPSVELKIMSEEIKSNISTDNSIFRYKKIIINTTKQFIEENINKILLSIIKKNINDTVIQYMTRLNENKEIKEWLGEAKNSGITENIIKDYQNNIYNIEKKWNETVLLLCDNESYYIHAVVKIFIDNIDVNEKIQSMDSKYVDEYEEFNYLIDLTNTLKKNLSIIIEHVLMLARNQISNNIKVNNEKIIEDLPYENKLYINTKCINTIINIVEKELVKKDEKKIEVNNEDDDDENNENEEKNSNNVDEVEFETELEEIIDDIKYSTNDYIDESDENKGIIDINEIEVYIPNTFSLYSHQKNAIKFLERQRLKNRGGILYHQMGLGKTKTACFYSIMSLKKNDGISMAIVPKSTVSQWIFEFVFILKFLNIQDVILCDMSFYDKNTLNTIKNNNNKNIIIITTISQLRIENRNKELTKLKLNTVIIDEIHMFKNTINMYNIERQPLYVETFVQIHKSIDKKIGQIIGLTGTPIKNDYKDLCSSLWITKIVNNDLNGMLNMYNNTDSKEIIEIFTNNSHKASEEELKIANKPTELYDIKYIESDSYFDNILIKNVNNLKRVGAQMRKSKNRSKKELFLKYLSMRTEYRMLESSGISSYIHSEQKKRIIDTITNKIENNIKVSSSEFWVGLDEQLSLFFSNNLNNEIKQYKNIVILSNNIETYKQQLEDNKQINYIDNNLTLKYKNTINKISQIIFNKLKEKNRTELINNYWKDTNSRISDNKSLIPILGPSRIKTLLELCPTPKIRMIVDDIQKHIEEKQKYKGSNLIVVSSQYILTLQIIKQYFNNNMNIYHGGLSLLQRKKMIEEFHNEKFSILGLSKQSGGTGLNLGKSSDGKTTVRTMFIVEPSENAFLDNQLKARLLRLGMGGSVKIVQYLYKTESVDQQLYARQIVTQSLMDEI